MVWKHFVDVSLNCRGDRKQLSKCSFKILQYMCLSTYFWAYALLLCAYIDLTCINMYIHIHTHFSYAHRLAESVLRVTFYWYNFMPLSRGTAACGYIGLLAMFLSSGLEVSERHSRSARVVHT